MSEIYEVADAVAQLLKGGTWPNSSKLDPERAYVPTVDLAKLAKSELRVFVVIAADEITVASRDGNQEEIQINIGLLQKLEPADDPRDVVDNEAVDPLLQLARAIALFFKPGIKAGDAVFTDSKYPVPYDSERLNVDHIFFAVIALKFVQEP